MIYGNCIMTGSSEALPKFTYTGDFEIYAGKSSEDNATEGVCIAYAKTENGETKVLNVTSDGNVRTFNYERSCSWRIRFLSSGTLTIQALGGLVNADIFFVGGGGGGGKQGSKNGPGSGGGGGYTKTKEYAFSVNTPYYLTIGAGGARQTGEKKNGNSGSPTFMCLTASVQSLLLSNFKENKEKAIEYACGGCGGGSDTPGGNGGSGGGSGNGTKTYYNGGSNGSNYSANGETPTMPEPNEDYELRQGKGQGSTTREFGDFDGFIYSGGGGGGVYNYSYSAQQPQAGKGLTATIGGKNGGGEGHNVKTKNIDKIDGTPNTGGGGGGAYGQQEAGPGTGGAGGSGIIVMRSHR